MVHPCCKFISTTHAAQFIAFCDLIFGLIGVFWFVFILEGYGLIDKDELYEYIYEADSFLPPARVRVVNVTPTATTTRRPMIHNITKITAPSHVENSSSTTTIQYFSVFTVSPNGIAIDGELGNICLSALYTAMNIALFVLLLNAINKRCIIKLTIWFWIRVFIILLKFVLYTTYLALGLSILTQSPHTIFILVHLYGLWIVRTLIKEIKVERRRASLAPATISQMENSVGAGAGTSVDNKVAA